MTLSSVIALILLFYAEFDCFCWPNYVTVVEDRPIMSIKYCPVPGTSWDDIGQSSLLKICFRIQIYCSSYQNGGDGKGTRVKN